MARRRRRSAPFGRGPTEERNSKTLGSQDNRSSWETSVVDLPVAEILAGLAMVCCQPRAFSNRVWLNHCPNHDDQPPSRFDEGVRLMISLHDYGVRLKCSEGCDPQDILACLPDEIRIEDPNCWNCGAPRERPEISDETIDIWDTCVFCGDWAQLRNCHNEPVCGSCEQAA